jgi:hypothetical protein
VGISTLTEKIKMIYPNPNSNTIHIVEEIADLIVETRLYSSGINRAIQDWEGCNGRLTHDERSAAMKLAQAKWEKATNKSWYYKH